MGIENLEYAMSPDHYRRSLDVRFKDGIWYFDLGTATTQSGMDWCIDNAVSGFGQNLMIKNNQIDWC